MLRRRKTFSRGDQVIFRVTKHSAKPGPRARDVMPDRTGDNYTYNVDKFWVVSRVCGDEVEMRTRRGKVHVFGVDDHNLRHAMWWEKILMRRRFPDLETVDGAAAPAEPSKPGA
ncbi:MAG: hypothetical protein CMJ18_19245 [Phycisphaeraceae bacterium]|nr:hypothetical protein [Phycisphaeraceae bacterium]